MQSGRTLGRPFGVLLKAGFPLMKSVLKPLAKSLLIRLGLTAAASAADAGMHKIALRIWDASINNFKWKIGWYHENS